MSESQKHFIPNHHDIVKWELSQQKSLFLLFIFRAILLLVVISVVIFLVFLEDFKPLNIPNIIALSCVALLTLFLNLHALSKTMNKNNYYELPSSKDSNGVTQCLFCGSTELNQRIKGTRTLECRCKKCKIVLFSHLDLSKEYTKNIDY